LQRSEHTAVNALTALLCSLLAIVWLFASSPALAQLVHGSMDVHWNEGVSNCVANPQPPIQVHPYNAEIFILRENPCSTAEAPLCICRWAPKALLIDTGDVADPKLMLLAQTVIALLPAQTSQTAN